MAPQGALPASTKGSLCPQESFPKPVFKERQGACLTCLGKSLMGKSKGTPAGRGPRESGDHYLGLRSGWGETAWDCPAVS